MPPAAGDPYCLPNGTLRNKLGITKQDELLEDEAQVVAGRERFLRARLPGPPFTFGTLQDIHRELFQDVYDWAGQPRTTVLAKREYDHPASPVQRFSAPGTVVVEAEDVFRRLAAQGFLAKATSAVFAQGAAEALAALNRVHPFREGNGRSQRLLIAALARNAGHDAAFDVVSRERMIAVSVWAHKGDLSGMRRMFDEIMDPRQVGAMRTVVGFLERGGFKWNDRYIATTRAGQDYEGTLVGRTGTDYFLRADSGSAAGHILVGDARDLPPSARSGDRITMHVSQFPPPEDIGSVQSPADVVAAALRPAAPVGPAPWDAGLTPLGPRLAAYMERLAAEAEAARRPSAPEPGATPDEAPAPSRPAPGRGPGPGS